MDNNRLLIMDDDVDVAAYFGEVAEGLDFDVSILNDPSCFFDTVAEVQPGLIILDLQLPGHDGVELLRGLAKRSSDARIFIVSGLDVRVLATAEQLARTLGLSVAGTFCKPIEPISLRALLMRHRKTHRKLSADELSYAIESGQLTVHYMPQATRTESGYWAIDGVEALVRWQHDKYGLIYPEEFIGLAEDSGLIVGLTDFVFRAAMDQARLWRDRGIDLELGLNLSADFLTDLGFPNRLEAMIREKQLDCSMISLELTDTSAFVDPELAMDILARLRVKRINVCLDDFGVGHSSFTHLYKMPFNELKLDNAFISDTRTSEDARHTVEGLIYLAHKLDMSVCAEGVEDQATFRMLDAMGCDRMQGYYFGRALPANDLERLVVSWNSGAEAREVSRTA